MLLRAFFTACKNNDLGTVCEMAFDDARVNVAADNNYAIRIAVELGHDQIVQVLLLNPKVDPSVDDNYPIKTASKKGFLEVVKQLLTHEKVNPCAQHNYAIAFAYINKHFDVVKELLMDRRMFNDVKEKFLKMLNENTTIKDNTAHSHEYYINQYIDENFDKTGNVMDWENLNSIFIGYKNWFKNKYDIKPTIKRVYMKNVLSNMGDDNGLRLIGHIFKSDKKPNTVDEFNTEDDTSVHDDKPVVTSVEQIKPNTVKILPIPVPMQQTKLEIKKDVSSEKPADITTYISSEKLADITTYISSEKPTDVITYDRQSSPRFVETIQVIEHFNDKNKLSASEIRRHVDLSTIKMQPAVDMRHDALQIIIYKIVDSHIKPNKIKLTCTYELEGNQMSLVNEIMDVLKSQEYTVKLIDDKKLLITW